MKNLKIIPATGKLDNQFVGIKILNNQIEFHYPETYFLSKEDDEKELRKDILSILRSVSLAKTKTSDLSSYNAEYSKDYEFPLGSYLWIINDYLTYGRYENREKEYQNGARGKIDWKRTLHSNPIVSNGNVIYTNIISEKKNQKDNLLTEIYLFCVQRAIHNIGWLYGLSFDSQGIDYEKIFNEKLYIGAINTELTHTFEDQKKIRLQNMKNIITGLDEENIKTKEVIYGVDSYEYVYERMVDSMFSNISNIRQFYPNATWSLILEPREIKSSSLRPDTVIVKNKKVYILDAKYYRYGTTFNPGDMPETTSIQKQITYGEYVKKVKAGQYDDVFSAFILPYSRYKNIHNDCFNKNLEYVGMAHAEWIDSGDESNRRIVAVLVDTKFLVNNWIKKNEDNLDKIIELIEIHVGDDKYDRY